MESRGGGLAGVYRPPSPAIPLSRINVVLYRLLGGAAGMPPPDAPGLIAPHLELLEDDPQSAGPASRGRRPRRIGWHLDHFGTSPHPMPCLPSTGSRGGPAGSIGGPPEAWGRSNSPLSCSAWGRRSSACGAYLLLLPTRRAQRIGGHLDYLEALQACRRLMLRG